MRTYLADVKAAASKAIAVALLVTVAFMAVPRIMGAVEGWLTGTCVGSYGVLVTCDNHPTAPKINKGGVDAQYPPTELACVNGHPVKNQDRCSFTRNGEIWITDGARSWKWEPVIPKH